MKKEYWMVWQKLLRGVHRKDDKNFVFGIKKLLGKFFSKKIFLNVNVFSGGREDDVEKEKWCFSECFFFIDNHSHKTIWVVECNISMEYTGLMIAITKTYISEKWVFMKLFLIQASLNDIVIKEVTENRW